jgi:GntR family transcriptional repressor for pyruvate dehydrogenase complex
LPPERELAEQIGVSRTVIREAVQVLVTKGLLETRHGVGTLVCQVSNNQFYESFNLFLLTHGVTLDDLHHVRSILEVENARLAALQATEADLARLRQILAEMEQVKADAQAFADKDAEFHTALAKTSHNPLMIILLDSIREPMQEIRLSVSQYSDLFATVMPDHSLIIEQIAARNAQGACQAMQAHLDHARAIQEKFLAQKINA